MNQSNDIAVEVSGLTKTFGSVVAVDAIDLTIDSGTYFVLLGPSGGGKTTLLRLVGGFARPTAGRVILHGQDVSELPPDMRPTSMVFQSYALFPHMSVERNVAYGLKLQKMPRDRIRDTVNNMLALVGLEGLNARMPHELSGGQQQRVQLARSLVLKRDILLLDEPLASLDAKLRKDMCLELKRIQEKVGITFIHVTHNQEEAMTIADRIAIIADGKMIEEGTARDIYERPIKRFTAEFIGENNLIDGRVAEKIGDRVVVDAGFATIAVDSGGMGAGIGDAVSVSIRSELFRLLDNDDVADDTLQTIPANYVEAVYLGLTTSHLVKLANGSEFAVRRLSDADPNASFAPGQQVSIGWRTKDARLHKD